MEENKRLQQEISNMQQVAVHAKKEVGEYLGKVEKHFLEDTFSAAENMAVMENYLQEWYVFHSIEFSSQLNLIRASNILGCIFLFIYDNYLKNFRPKMQ